MLALMFQLPLVQTLTLTDALDFRVDAVLFQLPLVQTLTLTI